MEFMFHLLVKKQKKHEKVFNFIYIEYPVCMVNKKINKNCESNLKGYPLSHTNIYLP